MPAKSTQPIPPALAQSPDYDVVRELNRGGMGVVYLVRNRRMDRLEAIKVVNPAVIERTGALERFEREMRAAARLNHPNIVSAYSSPPLEGLLAFAMEYVEGTDLNELVKSRGPLTIPVACYYIHQAALGLQHARDRNMVHRDIKPGNLVLTRDGKRQIIKILDFGLAKATSENPVEGGLTGAGQVLGTPLFMAPEQITNAAAADVRADIYSLGCSLYFLLTGTPPFHDKSHVYEILHAHLKEIPRALHEVRGDVPVELSAIVAKMVAKDPLERYQQPREVAQALATFIKSGLKAAEPANAGTPEMADTSQAMTFAERDGRKAPQTACTRAWQFLARTPRWVLAATGIAALLVAGIWTAGLIRKKPAVGSDVEIAKNDAETVSDDGGKGGASATAPPELARGDFVSLFNGQDFTGWKITRDDYRSWRVENGEIAVSCANWKSSSVLYSEKRFANYRLRLEYKVDPGARCRFVPRFAEGDTHIDGEPLQAGIGILDDEYFQAHVELRGPRYTGSFLVSRDLKNHVPVEEPPEPLPSGSWNLLEVEVRAQALTCAVNGKMILRTNLDDLAARDNAFPGLRQTYAPIGLEGAMGTVRFRNLAVEELPTTATSRSGPPAGEHAVLFNGRDLEGWKPVDVGRRGLSSRWRVFNGAIAASAPIEEPHPPLFLSTEREFGQFVLHFEFRKTREPARGNIVYHAVSGRRHAVLLVHDGEPAGTLVGAIRHASGKIRYPLDYAPLKGADEWNQVEIEVSPGLVRVVMNGVEVQKTTSQGDEKSDTEAAAAMKPSRLGFTVTQGELEFRNVEIWE